MIEEFLAARGVTGSVTDVERMLGGASRETWALQLDGRRLVLRRDPPGAPRAGAMAGEAAVMQAARAAGVPVAEVVRSGDDFILMSRLDGETLARRILRDDKYVTARSRLTGQCARALAVLHTQVDPSSLPTLRDDQDPLASLRSLLDDLGEPHPGLELGLLRLARTRPSISGGVVVHGDFRLGNLVIDSEGLVGALDWELAHVGDPVEDLGWMCVRSWRFGGPLPVAGVGTRHDLLTAYADAGGPVVDEQTLRWWEAVGTLRWGVICIQQAAAHLSGAVQSLELAAIGRRTAEVELDLLDLVAPASADTPEPAETPEPADAVARVTPHDRPTAAELADAVVGWLDGLSLAGPDAFLRRVAANAVGILGRESMSAPAMADRHRDRLHRLGVADDAELARQIRDGRDGDDVVAAVRAAVVDKVWVADPRQLQRLV